MITTYNKVIRDKIPEIIEDSGKKGIVKQLTDEEFLPELEKKLNEEVNEYLSSGEIEELADIIEIINRILELRNVGRKDFDTIRLEKMKTRGGFDRNYYLLEVRDINWRVINVYSGVSLEASQFSSRYLLIVVDILRGLHHLALRGEQLHNEPRLHQGHAEEYPEKIVGGKREREDEPEVTQLHV